MAIYKNKASQKLAVYAYDSTDGSAKTGDAANITAQISLDGGVTAATNDVNPTELDVTDAPGVYIFDLTQAETNADMVILAAKSATANILLEPLLVYTQPEIRVSTISGTITTLDALDTAQDSQHATTQSKVDTAQADLDLLTGTDGATLATSQPNYAPATATALSTAQADLDTLTGADGAIISSASEASVVDAVWDEPLSAATHNIATSAGRRLRNIQDFGIYDLASVWVDEVNGTSTGTTAGEDATVTNRATDFDNAQTIAAAIDLDRIYVSSGNSITLTGPLLAYNIWGFNYSIALGGQDVSGTLFDHATISGIGTGTGTHIHNSEIGTVTIGAGAEIRNSGLSGTLTLGAAGDYELIDCVSLVAGVGTPTIDMDAALGASNLNIRRWSGGLTLSNIGTGDVVSIDGITGGTVTLTMTGGTVEVRGAGMKALVINGSGGTVNVSGFFGTITDNSGGAITVADTWALNRSIVNSECDTALTDYGANTTTPPTVAAIADAVWDETDTDHATADTFGGNLQNAVVSGGDATEANQTTIITHLTDIKGATFNGATDSLEEIRDRGDAAWITGGAGSGAITFTYTLTDADTTDPIPDALVAVYSDVGMTALVAAARTDVNGQAVFSLDAGTYYLRRTKAGYNFTNPDTEVVA